MHRVTKLIEYAMTRNVELLNERAGTIDLCFDYTLGFEFIQEGEAYDCKILLVGGLAEMRHAIWDLGDK